MLPKGKIRVQLIDPNYDSMLIDTSYHEHKYLSVRGIVKEIGDLSIPFRPEYHTGKDDEEYYATVGVEVGDVVLMRWLDVSGSPDFDGDVIIPYNGVIGVIGEELSLRNSYLLIDSNKVLAASVEFPNMPNAGDYVITKFSFNIDYLGELERVKFAEYNDILVFSDEPMNPLIYEII